MGCVGDILIGDEDGVGLSGDVDCLNGIVSEYGNDLVGTTSPHLTIMACWYKL